jgi:hypothetical protein
MRIRIPIFLDSDLGSAKTLGFGLILNTTGTGLKIGRQIIFGLGSLY